MNSDIPVVILCGGVGVFIDGSGQRTAKPLVKVAGRPLFAHVVDLYVSAGFRKFILAAGYQKDALVRTAKELFPSGNPLCHVEVIDTGESNTTGERVKSALSHVGSAKTIAVAYSDTVARIDLNALVADHRARGKLATLVGARMPLRFRVLGMRDGDCLVRGFASRPVIQRELINGGFFLFERAALMAPYMPDTDAILETHVLEALAAKSELVAHPFEGAWQFLDSERDIAAVERVVRDLPRVKSLTPPVS